MAASVRQRSSRRGRHPGPSVAGHPRSGRLGPDPWHGRDKASCGGLFLVHRPVSSTRTPAADFPAPQRQRRHTPDSGPSSAPSPTPPGQPDAVLLAGGTGFSGSQRQRNRTARPVSARSTERTDWIRGARRRAYDIVLDPGSAGAVWRRLWRQRRHPEVQPTVVASFQQAFDHRHQLPGPANDRIALAPEQSQALRAPLSGQNLHRLGGWAARQFELRNSSCTREGRCGSQHDAGTYTHRESRTSCWSGPISPRTLTNGKDHADRHGLSSPVRRPGGTSGRRIACASRAGNGARFCAGTDGGLVRGDIGGGSCANLSGNIQQHPVLRRRSRRSARSYAHLRLALRTNSSSGRSAGLVWGSRPGSPARRHDESGGAGQPDYRGSGRLPESRGFPSLHQARSAAAVQSLLSTLPTTGLVGGAFSLWVTRRRSPYRRLSPSACGPPCSVASNCIRRRQPQRVALLRVTEISSGALGTGSCGRRDPMSMAPAGSGLVAGSRRRPRVFAVPMSMPPAAVVPKPAPICPPRPWHHRCLRGPAAMPGASNT